MANAEIFKGLTKAILAVGEKQSSDDKRIVTASELTLIAVSQDGKIRPMAIVFPLFGVDFIMLPEGTIALSDPESTDEDDSYLDLQDEETLKRIDFYLHWRIETLTEVGL
jgi:hypothetical protein